MMGYGCVANSICRGNIFLDELEILIPLLLVSCNPQTDKNSTNNININDSIWIR